MSSKIYQIKISIKDSYPLIWRRLYIHSDILLTDFHKMLQTVVGWSNAYSHQFIKDDVYYVLPSDNFGNDGATIDYREKKVSDLLDDEENKIFYEYDFRDRWLHEIELENILDVDPHNTYPFCQDGELHCPPEGCGGVEGYDDLLSILSDIDNEEYYETIKWLGEDFDAHEFDKCFVNEMLRRKNFGCKVY